MKMRLHWDDDEDEPAKTFGIEEAVSYALTPDCDRYDDNLGRLERIEWTKEQTEALLGRLIRQLLQSHALTESDVVTVIGSMFVAVPDPEGVA